MKELSYHLFFTSPKSLLISFDFKEYNRQSIQVLQYVKTKIEAKFKTQVSYTTPAFDTLLVVFKTNDLILDAVKIEVEDILKNLSFEKVTEINFNTYEIPVCYEVFGKDLDALAKHSGYKIEEIIKIHSEHIYTLYFIGFMPGFLYMGSVDERIIMPRLKTPRPKVEKGSVGIAENQTGIYPNDSPGGWQIIGRTPIDIFNAEKEPPSIFRPGDQIKFNPIDEKTFNTIINKTNFELKIL